MAERQTQATPLGIRDALCAQTHTQEDAYELALAERWAEDEGLVWQWEYEDTGTWACFALRYWEHPTRPCRGAAHSCYDVVASRYGVEDGDEQTRREHIQAELALEAMGEVRYGIGPAH